MTDAQGRDQEAPTEAMEVQYHVEVTRTVCVVADDEAQAFARASERLGHLIVEEGAKFPDYCRYEITGAESVPAVDAAGEPRTDPGDQTCEGAAGPDAS